MTSHAHRLRFHAALIAAAALQWAVVPSSFAQGGPPEQHRDADRDEHRGPAQPAASHQPQREPEHQQTTHSSAGDQGARGHYEFRDQDRAQLQAHYKKSIGHVDRNHRPHFEPGKPIPAAYRGGITPAPVSVRRRLPPPPDGYTVGYYQGYTVVYDPATQIVLSVLDLLSQ
jgi:Ni/Co efflux regulator RcnB